jgi:hypothetical protein
MSNVMLSPQYSILCRNCTGPVKQLRTSLDLICISVQLLLLLLLLLLMLHTCSGIGYIAYAWMACTSAIERKVATALSDPVCDRQHFRTMADAFLREHPNALFVQVTAAALSGWLGWVGGWVSCGSGEGEVITMQWLSFCGCLQMQWLGWLHRGCLQLQMRAGGACSLVGWSEQQTGKGGSVCGATGLRPAHVM